MTINWRPARVDDAAAMTATLNACLELAGSHELTTEQSVREELAGPFWDLALDTVVAEHDGVAVAFGGVIAPPGGGTTMRSRAAVHPDHRGLGIGSELLDRLVHRASDVHASSGSAEPWLLRQGSEDGDPTSGRLLAAHGFAPVRFWFEMHRDLENVLAAERIDGLELREFRDGDTETVYAAHHAAFADHWGSQDRGLDSFRTRVTASAAFRPALCRIAITADGVVAGYALTFVEADPNTVLFGLIGTRREWRGKGVASELVRRSLTASREAGLSAASLLVDGDSPTGAVGVYERLGFTVAGRSTSYERQIG